MQRHRLFWRWPSLKSQALQIRSSRTPFLTTTKHFECSSYDKTPPSKHAANCLTESKTSGLRLHLSMFEPGYRYYAIVVYPSLADYGQFDVYTIRSRVQVAPSPSPSLYRGKAYRPSSPFSVPLYDAIICD